ncbi:MAG: hypothetical protein WCE23_11650 [Candidatus Binatus sp.]|uniref:hypothetical protein n=1 Tax=Candidatus Binatus sp. TaxID=2811406 RepID=UPI003C74A36A
MDTIIQQFLNHISRERAVITGAPIIFIACMLGASAVMFYLMRLYFHHQISSRDTIISVHEERKNWLEDRLKSATINPAAVVSGQRRITREQWEKIEAARRSNPKKWPQLILKLPFNDLEAEEYAQGLGQLLYCGVGRDARLTPEFKGLILRVRDRTALSPAAQFFSKTLTEAGLPHQVSELDLQFPIDQNLDCELVVGGQPNV